LPALASSWELGNCGAHVREANILLMVSGFTEARVVIMEGSIELHNNCPFLPQQTSSLSLISGAIKLNNDDTEMKFKQKEYLFLLLLLLCFAIFSSHYPVLFS
jgi:hypothetical protein